MKTTLDNSKRLRILSCINEDGIIGPCPCELGDACREYIEEVKKHER